MTPSRFSRCILPLALLAVAGCASDYGPPGTGNSGRGHTASMATAMEMDNSPSPGGFGGAASRTMGGGPGSATLIGTETGLQGPVSGTAR